MSNYITADEIIRRKKYESLFDDDSYRTADEIIEAAKKRDLTEKYNNSDDRSIYYRDRTVDNPLQSTRNTPEQNNSAQDNSWLGKANRSVYNSLAKRYTDQTEAFQKLNLPDSPSYTQIKDTISSQEQQKSAAARRGKDTSAYDKAIEMLRGYADKNYGFDTNTSASDREALYADKKRELKQLQNEEKATDKTRPVDYYSKDDIVSILKSRGASYDHTAEENADFFIKYRQHIIPHGNDDKDENARRYQGLLAVIEQSNKELPNEKIAELQSKQSAIQDELRYYEKNKQSLENLEKTPEELVKDIDSEPFDYTNVEDVKGALGVGSDADAEFFVKYRQHIIPHGNDDNDENARKYQRLLEAVNLTAKSQGAKKMYSQGEEVAAVSKSGQTMNYRDLLTHKVARNREADLTVSQEEAGNILKSLGTGSRDLTQLPTLTDKEQKAAGWYSNFKNGYHSYTYKGDVENGEVEDKSAVFSAIVTDSKGNVVRVLSPSEMEEYAQKALSTGDDPLKLQATETYAGFMGTSLAVENAKRINRLSERYFNNTDLESVVDAAISGDKYAQSNADQYGLDVDEIRHYRYITDTQKQKQQASRDYAEWSAENIGTGALATGANILASPLKAAEFVINLGESWDNNIKANRSGGISSYRLPANYDDFVTSMTNESTEQITEGIRNSIKGNGDSAVLNWLGDVTANTYGGVASSAQSALTGLTARAIFGPGAGEVVALTVMSGEAANDAFNEVIDNGGTTSQAIMYGIASGTNEALFEKVSLDHLINVKDVIGKEGIKDIFLSALKQGGIEASEEAFTELANRFADDVINTDKSEYNRNVQKYIDEGYSDEEAKSKANLDFAGQVMASAWGGFVGGGFSTGTKVVSNTVANAVQQKAETRQAGAAIADAKNIPALIEQANAVEGSEKITTQAAKVKALYDKNGGEKITGSLKKEAGTLYNMLQDHNVDNARSASGNTVREAIRERVIAETGSDDSVAVEAIYKSEISGEKLSTMEQNALKEKSVQKVVNYVQENAEQIRNDARVSTENAFANIAETAALTRTENDIFTASDDGKTYIKGQNTPVTVQKVRSVSENDMDIELTDGTVVKASNIDFGDPGVKTILSNMIDIQNDQSRSAKMSAEYVNTALQTWQQGNYSESNLGAFTHDAREIYNAANNNDKYSPKLMSQGVADMLYTAATNSKKANIATRSAKIQQKKTGTRREGTVVFDDAINESSLNPLQKVGIDTVRQLAKSTGITFHFFQSKKNAAGKYVHEKHSARDKNGNLIASPNGFYSNGEIWVDINAGNNGEGLILFTVSHELVHFMSDFAPEQFDTFAKFLFDNYANDNLTIKQAVYREMTHNTNLKYDEAYEEVVARLSEAFLRDAHLTEKSRELYNTDKNVWEKIRDGLKDIVDRIEKFFAKLSPDSELGKIGQKMVRENQEILDRFLAGVRAAADNAAYIENTTGEGGVLYDLRGYSEQQKNNWKTSKRIVVYENDTQFGGFITTAKADATYNQKMYFGAISHNLAAVIKAHTNIDVENYNLSLSASEIRKIFKSHGSEKTEAPRGQRAVTDADIIKIPSIVKGATKISTCGYYNGKPMIEFVKQENNERYTVRAVVSDKRLDLFVQTSFIGVKKGSLATPTGVQAPINTPKANSGTASVNSVSQKIQNNNPNQQNNSPHQDRDTDYLAAVNRGDMDTAQRMVDEAAERAFADSKIRGEDGKLIKVYHGTDADFTVFDRTMGRSNMDIQGLFFSPWDIDAGGYGQNVRAFYLNITNPADESTGYKALNAHKGENYAGIKAREDLEKAGYDGVNNSDEEYIAFTSEQIKSADPVTYDDNGDVIPLSERFNSEEKDIRYDDNRAGDLFSGDDDLSFGEFDNISDVITRNYTTHSEAIGEVLKNTADIDIASGKVYNIVAHTLDGYNIDTDTKKKLATQLHLELENAKNGDPEEIVNRMIDTVRGVLDDAKEVDQRAVEQYNDLKAAYSGKYYLTDEQIMDLKENGYTLNDFKKAMTGKMTIVKKENAARSINGGFKDASPLSLEGIHDEIDAEEILGITRDQWDKYGYHAPVMLMKAFEKLKNNQLVPLTDISSAEDRDYIAVDLAAHFTGAVVQEKYNSRKNPYVRDLVNKFEARKKEAVKKRNAYYAEKMKEIREQRDKRVAEQLQKAKEARKNATVQRKRAELKERIRKMHKSLSDMALNPKVKKYIPGDLMEQSIDVLSAINLDSGFNGERADKFRAKLNKLSLALKDRALNFKDEAAYNTTVADMLDNLNETIGSTPLGVMSLDQLKRVHDTLKAVQTNIRNRVLEIGAENARYIGDIAFRFIDEIDDARIHKVLGSKYDVKMLSAERFLNLICDGAKNNVGKYVVYRMLDDGQLKQIELETRFARMFEGLVNDKQAKTLKQKVDIGLVDDYGNKVMISRGMMLSLYMHLMNEDNIRHVMGGGLTIPFIKKNYEGDTDNKRGNKPVRVRDSTSEARNIAKQIKELHDQIKDDTPQVEKDRIWDKIHDLEALFDEEVERGKKEYINPMRSRIEQQMSEYDREWIRTAQQFLDVESKNELNKVTYQLYGFEKAVVKHYFPIHTDTSFNSKEFDSIVRDMNLENIGMMKSRIHSANAIYLEDIADVINKQISNVSQYCGMVIPMANVKNIINFKADTNADAKSVKASLRKFDDPAKKNTTSEAVVKNRALSYLEKLLGDFVGANKGETTLLDKARHGIAGASLTMNFKVAIKQAASFPTAAAELGYTPLVKALVKGGKNNWMLSRADKELIYKYSPLLAYRSMGYSNQVLGDLKDSGGFADKLINNPKMRWAFGWIQAMDTATVGRLWYASQYYVDKESPNLQKGSDEYYKEVARVFNNVIERTQPNYTVLQRPEILRSNNAAVKMFTMFMTQRLQNFNIVYDTAITLNKMKSDLKNQKNGVTLQDVREARTNHARAISSQMLAAAVLVGMTFLADALMHKMNPWRDDDEELTEESITKRGLLYLGDSLVGSIAGGSELYNMMVAAFGDGTWYGLSANGFDSVDDLLTNVTKGIKEKDGKYFAKAAKSLAQISGLPLQNAVNILIATKRHTEDIKDGKFLSYESGVNRTDKQNLHRSWSAYTLGNSSDSTSIMDELKDSKVQEQIAKGKSDADAKKEAYSNLRTTVRALLREDYLKARNDYYHGDHNDADYETISLITSFMTKSGLYSKPSVQDTLDKWWKDAEAKAQEGNKTMSEYLQTDGFNLWSFMGDTVSELSSGLFE